MKRGILLFLLLATTSILTFASHYMGADMSYECLGGCTYRVYNYTYYDCDGAATSLPPNIAPAPSVDFVGQPAGCTPATPPQIGAWTFISYDEVTPVCPTAQTRCDPATPNAQINGVLGAAYYADFNLCNSTCTSYIVTFYNCCRNYAITSGAGGNGIFLDSTIIDLTITPCNSSPVFNNEPVPYICANYQFTFNQGAYDPDGDSLVYSIGPCNTGAGTNVTYNAGFSPTSPLGPNWIVTIDPQTGDVTFDPNPNGPVLVAVLCIIVEEYRNGIKIGQITRDMQITVLNCTIQPPALSTLSNYEINGVNAQGLVDGLSAIACVGVPVCLQLAIDTAALQPNMQYTMYWDNGIPSGVFYDSSNGAIQDTVVSNNPIAQFCFTPTAPGLYTFLVSVRDTNCPIQGFNQYTVKIDVQNSANNAQAIVTNLNCNVVEFVPIPDTSAVGPFDFIWIGSGGLNTTDSAFTYSYPSTGVQQWQLTIQDTFGCVANLNGSINIPSGAEADAGPDYVICSGFAHQLGAPAIAGQTYSWSPATNLSSTTISNPNVTLYNNGPGNDTVVYTVTAYANQCSTTSEVTAIILPAPPATILPLSPNICLGDSVQLTASGGSNFLWSTGESTSSIWVKPTNTTTYSVISFLNGCASPPTLATVNVIPGPIGNISGILSVCNGGMTTLTASGGSSFIWNNGNATNTLALNPVNVNTPVWMIPSQGLCNGDTVFAVVVANDNPTANFTSSTECAGNPTQFTDLSNILSGNIIGWSWNFGDPSSQSNTSNLQNPAHTYQQNGTYNATLTVISEHGCSHTVVLPVTVTAIPNIDFAFQNVCVGTRTIFDNQTSIAPGNSVTNYTWDFGDSGFPFVTQSDTNVSHVYQVHGYYNVTIQAVSDNGCVTQFTKTVFVHPKPDANFIADASCRVDSMQFSNTSTIAGNLDYIGIFAWNFGDPGSGIANFSNAINPKHLYGASNQYNVTYIVETNHGCRDTIVKPVTVYAQPTADFSVVDRCSNEVAKFTDLSSVSTGAQIVKWAWDFGVPGSNADIASPSYDYNVAGAGTYPVTLIVTSDENCKDTITRDLIINPTPGTSFTASVPCFGDTTFFTNTTTILTGAVDSYSWIIQENPLIATSDVNPKFLYPEDSLHVVTLTAVSDSGCVHTIVKGVYVNPLPLLPNVRVDTICQGEPAVLSFETPDKVTWYHSPTDLDAFYVGNSYITPPLAYTQTYYVQLVTPRGCVSNWYPVSATVRNEEEVYITVSDTLIELPADAIQFATSNSSQLVNWIWDFKDGATSVLPTPSHEYQYPGTYNVHLTAIDEYGCRYERDKVIEVKRVVTITPPSAFSPNDDGFNDFYYVGYYNLNQFSIEIFDRWGHLMFESNDAAFKWDGKDKSGKELPEGVYVYVIKTVAFDGNKENKTGTISLMR